MYANEIKKIVYHKNEITFFILVKFIFTNLFVQYILFKDKICHNLKYKKSIYGGGGINAKIVSIRSIPLGQGLLEYYRDISDT